MATCCNEQPEPPRARQEGVFLNFPAPSEGAVRAPQLVCPAAEGSEPILPANASVGVDVSRDCGLVSTSVDLDSYLPTLSVSAVTTVRVFTRMSVYSTRSSTS